MTRYEFGTLTPLASRPYSSRKTARAEDQMKGINIKPFRFGVNVRYARSRSEWVEKACKIETLGYDTFNVPDHLTDHLAPLPALVSAAEAPTIYGSARTFSITTFAIPCWSRERPRRLIFSQTDVWNSA